MLTKEIIEQADGQLAWLFELTWRGRVHYLATRDYFVDSDQGDLHFRGLLDDGIVFRMAFAAGKEYGEARSVPMTLWFDEDVLKALAKGHDLQMATGVLSLWAVGSAYEDREVMFRGQPRRVEYGADGDNHKVVFSLSQPPWEDGILLPSATEAIEQGTWPLAREDAVQKWYQVIVGRPGGGLVPASPAWAVEPGEPPGRLLIARGLIAANTVDIVGMTSGAPDVVDFAVPVVVRQDAVGQTVSVVEPDSLSSDLRGTDKYYVQWSNGGGIAAWDSEEARSASEVVAALLRTSGMPIDHAALLASRDYLSTFLIDAAIADGPARAFDFIADKILPLVPAQLAMGPRGIRLEVLQLDARGAEIDAVARGWVRSSVGTVPDLDDIVNEVRVSFDFKRTRSGDTDGLRQRGEVILDGDNSRRDPLLPDRAQPIDIAVKSRQRYGTRMLAIQADSVSDLATAKEIATWVLRRRALPQRVVTYQIPTMDLPLVGLLARIDLLDDTAGINARGAIEGLEFSEGGTLLISWREIMG